MEYVQTFDCNVIERNGHHFLNITNASTEVKLEDFSMKFVCAKGISLITEMINNAANANRRRIFRENERNIKQILSDAGQAFITPIFNKFSIEELLQNDCQ